MHIICNIIFCIQTLSPPGHRIDLHTFFVWQPSANEQNNRTEVVAQFTWLHNNLSTNASVCASLSRFSSSVDFQVNALQFVFFDISHYENHCKMLATRIQCCSQCYWILFDYRVDLTCSTTWSRLNEPVCIVSSSAISVAHMNVSINVPFHFQLCTIDLPEWWWRCIVIY